MVILIKRVLFFVLRIKTHVVRMEALLSFLQHSSTTSLKWTLVSCHCLNFWVATSLCMDSNPLPFRPGFEGGRGAFWLFHLSLPIGLFLNGKQQEKRRRFEQLIFPNWSRGLGDCARLYVRTCVVRTLVCVQTSGGKKGRKKKEGEILERSGPLFAKVTERTSERAKKESEKQAISLLFRPFSFLLLLPPCPTLPKQAC